MTHPLASLDDLFAEAKAGLRQMEAAKEAKKATPKRVKEDEAPKPPSALYTNPENWKQGRNITLIHRETRTLLGVFTEWLHVSVPGARRLVRNENGVFCSAIEEVDGDWGWTGPQKLPQEELLKRIKVECFLSLEFPPVAVMTEVEAVVSSGAMLALELCAEATFKGAFEYLTLPKGTNVLGQLRYETKKFIWEEVKCQLS